MHAPQDFLKDNACQGGRGGLLKIPQAEEAEMQENSAEFRDAPQIIRFSDRLVETYILRGVPELRRMGWNISRIEI